MPPLAPDFGKIPEFFSKRCAEFSLPIDTVQTDTQGFIRAILALPDYTQQTYMHRYLEYGNQLFYYLRREGVAPGESGRIAKEVLAGLKEASIPLSYRTLEK